MSGQVVKTCFLVGVWGLMLTVVSSCSITFGINGTFTLSPGSDTAWLKSGPVSFRIERKFFTTADGSLKFSMPYKPKTGQDKIGNYTEYGFKFVAEGVYLMETFVRQYKDIPVLVFTQSFKNGIILAKTDFDSTITAFPSFRVGDTSASLGYLSYGGIMFGDLGKKIGKWAKGADLNHGMENSGPLAVYDKTGRAVVISPLDNFIASSMSYDKDNSILSWGIMGGVDSVPPEFKTSTIAFCSDSGIGEAFNGWGKVMRGVYKKTDEVINYHHAQDITLTHLGYWTDTGDYYYYHTIPNKTYEETMLDVRKFADSNSIPYRYYLLDSWFYAKDDHGAVTLWDAMKSVFPSGLPGFHKELGDPLAAHNRYWSPMTPYAKQNGGLFDFYVEEKTSLPVEQAFWDYLLGHAAEEWGLVMYKQDWLVKQTQQMEALNTNLTLGHLWLSQMAEAALRYGVKIQYCMSMSRHALSSLEFPVVTQARASADYLSRPDQWKVGVVSHFAHAMGVAPSKDTLWTVNVQPGSKDNKREPYPSLQIAVATLSTANVGPGDGIGYTNVSLLMRCCDNNGLILKPSAPAKAIDDQLIGSAFKDGSGVTTEVWSTYCNHVNTLYGIILAVELADKYVITPAKAGFLSKSSPEFLTSVLYSIEKDTPIIHDLKFNSSSQFALQPDSCKTNNEPFCLLYTSPYLTVGGHSVALLGDLTKWVPMSELRIVNGWLKDDGLTLALGGRQGESITMTYIVDNTVYHQTGKANDKDCVFFTIVNGSGPNNPPDFDCRFKAPPFPTPGAGTRRRL